MNTPQNDNPASLDPLRKETSLVRRSGFLARRVRELAQQVREHDLAETAHPQDAYDYYTKGLSQYDRCEYERAIENFGEAIRLNPQYALAYSYRGLVYYYLGQYERAIEDYD